MNDGKNSAAGFGRFWGDYSLCRDVRCAQFILRQLQFGFVIKWAKKYDIKRLFVLITKLGNRYFFVTEFFDLLKRRVCCNGVVVNPRLQAQRQGASARCNQQRIVARQIFSLAASGTAIDGLFRRSAVLLVGGRLTDGLSADDVTKQACEQNNSANDDDKRFAHVSSYLLTWLMKIAVSVFGRHSKLTKPRSRATMVTGFS